jgi:hypothetical protein
MSYPNNQGQVENNQVLHSPFPNPYSDPVVQGINESIAHEDHDYEVMFSEDRWEWYERYCKAHLEDYLKWTWEARGE